MKSIVTAAFGLLPLAANLFAADLTGDWEFAGTALGDTKYARITFKSDGDKLSGRLNEITLNGSSTGDEVRFSGARGTNKFGDFSGTVHGDKMEGTAKWEGDQDVIWSARRSPAPPASPQTHSFEPKEFHRVFADSVAPALRIFPGDTVKTWTVDAGGFDSKGVRKSSGGNPQTGPFYIEGAMPGDLLAVKLDRIRLNRDFAVSGNRLMAQAMNPWTLPKFNDEVDATWTLDTEKLIGRLKHPTEHLTNYTVKLQPMLGCIAVAPPGHQSFRTGYLGNYGGNMDYNQIREGTTVYLPVFVPGALLFVGDGHAAQGDGELTGDALETSMDIEFTVTLEKGASTGAPFAENDDYIMALGIAGSLHEALQGSTSSLFDRLRREYHLDAAEASMVLGTAMEYNVAEVVDPLTHVVAKIRKSALAPLKR